MCPYLPLLVLAPQCPVYARLALFHFKSSVAGLCRVKQAELMFAAQAGKKNSIVFLALSTQGMAELRQRCCS